MSEETRFDDQASAGGEPAGVPVGHDGARVDVTERAAWSANGAVALLVVIGLLISVPIVVWGSSVVLKLVDRFPSITYLGAGVLAWTAAKMMVGEPALRDVFTAHPWTSWVLLAGVVAGVLAAGGWAGRKLRDKTLAA